MQALEARCKARQTHRGDKRVALYPWRWALGLGQVKHSIGWPSLAPGSGDRPAGGLGGQAQREQSTQVEAGESGGLPPQVEGERLDRLGIRRALERLEHDDGGDDVCRHAGATPAEGNRPANTSSGNSFRRCSAKT